MLTGDEELDALLRADEPAERESNTEVAVDLRALVQGEPSLDPAGESSLDPAGEDVFEAGANEAATVEQDTRTPVVALTEQVVAELAPDADELEPPDEPTSAVLPAAPPAQAAAAPASPAAGMGRWPGDELDDVEDLSFSLDGSGRAGAAAGVTAGCHRLDLLRQCVRVETDGRGQRAGRPGKGIRRTEASGVTASAGAPGLDKASESYANRVGITQQHCDAVDRMTANKIPDEDIQTFLKAGRLGEYAE